jgi:hypothetical protein
VNAVKPTCESALRSAQAICIALGKEVYCVCSRVDYWRSGYADFVLDIIAESIGRLESRIKSPVLNQCASYTVEDPMFWVDTRTRSSCVEPVRVYMTGLALNSSLVLYLLVQTLGQLVISVGLML